MSLSQRGPIPLLMAACLLLLSCNQSDPPRQTGKPLDSTPTVKGALPAGRFELPLRNTPAPAMFVTLPEGYSIKDASAMPNDEYYIIRKDDPNLYDSNDITPGFLRVYVGTTPQSGLDSAGKFSEERVLLGSMPLVWKIWSEQLSDSIRYHSREITSSDYFASISPELARYPLYIHIYIGGRDTARIADLTAAVTTLSLTP